MSASGGVVCANIRLLVLCGRSPPAPLVAGNAAAGAPNTSAGKLVCKAVCEETHRGIEYFVRSYVS